MLSISIANCIRFRPVNSEAPNFDNTFDDEQTAHDRLINDQFQQRYRGDYVLVQAMSNTGEAVLCRALYNGVFQNVPIDSVTSLAGKDYTDFVIDFDATFITGLVQFEIYTDTQTFRSEPILCDELDENYIKLEWFNIGSAFTLNYGTGIVPRLWLYAQLNITTAAGETTVYVNQGNETKLKELVQRVFNLEAYIPAHIAEQITVAMAHDHFFINDIEFVNDKKPAFERQGNSNIYKLTVDLIQRTVLGLNTHEPAFDVDAITDAIMTEDGLTFISTNAGSYFQQ